MWFGKIALGPSDEAGDAVSAFPEFGFFASHSGVEILWAEKAAVVCFEDKDGVFGQTLMIEELHQISHVGVDVADHAEVTGKAVFEPLVEMIKLGVGESFGDDFAVFWFRNEGAVRGVGGEVTEEGFILLGGVLDELFGFGEEDIGAVAFESFLHAILGVDIVEVVVTPVGGN